MSAQPISLDSLVAPTEPQAVIKPRIIPHTDWQFDHLLLRTTHRNCRCGSKHSNVELYEVWIAESRLLGRRDVISRLIPYDKPNIPQNWEILQSVRTLPLAVCPHCIVGRIRVQFRPLDEGEWQRAVRKKQSERPIIIAANVAKATSTKPSFDDLAKKFNL